MFDARGLHEWLGVKDPFSQWVRRRITEYRFVSSEDFFTSLLKTPQTKGRPRREYLITIDMAKELSMVERTERGRQTRRYFIEMEKAAREMAATLIEQGQPHAVPQVAFDALAFKQDLLAEIKALLPKPAVAATPADWPERVTAAASRY